MINNLFQVIFKIIDLVWHAPTWLVFLVIILIAVVYFFQGLFGLDDGSDSSGGMGFRGGSSPTYVDESRQKDKQPFIFYDNNGERRGRGDCFYDSKGYFRSWGDGFYDGKGYYRGWGDSYYDARGYFRSWGECFYDAQGNLVYPD